MNPYDFAVHILHDNRAAREDMLYSAASIFTGLDKSSFKKAADEKGKPFFEGMPDLHFSISHSGGYWACAFGRSRLGLDLQRHDGCRRESIAKRFFHRDEAEYLESRSYAEKDFFELWAKKESYVKYVGEGLGIGLESFSVLDAEKDYELRVLPFIEGYTLCLCSKRIEAVRLHFEDTADL